MARIATSIDPCLTAESPLSAFLDPEKVNCLAEEAKRYEEMDWDEFAELTRQGTGSVQTARSLPQTEEVWYASYFER